MRRGLEEHANWAINTFTLFLGRDETGRFSQRIEQVPKVKQPAESLNLFVASMSFTICNQRPVLEAEPMIRQPASRKRKHTYKGIVIASVIDSKWYLELNNFSRLTQKSTTRIDPK